MDLPKSQNLFWKMNGNISKHWSHISVFTCSTNLFWIVDVAAPPLLVPHNTCEQQQTCHCIIRSLYYNKYWLCYDFWNKIYCSCSTTTSIKWTQRTKYTTFLNSPRRRTSRTVRRYPVWWSIFFSQYFVDCFWCVSVIESQHFSNMAPFSRFCLLWTSRVAYKMYSSLARI